MRKLKYYTNMAGMHVPSVLSRAVLTHAAPGVHTAHAYHSICQGVITLLSIMMLQGCSDSFSTRYERIDADRVRPLAMVFEPAEAAPGDTVTAKVYWSGIPVTSVYWGISFNYIFNLLGIDTAVDTFNLSTSPWAVPGSDTLISASDSAGMSYASIRFIIPADIIRDNITASEQLVASLPPALMSAVPPEIASDPALIADIAELTAVMYAVNIDSLLLFDTITAADIGIDTALLTSLSSLTAEQAGAGAVTDLRTLLILMKALRDDPATQRDAAKAAQNLTVRIKIIANANDIYNGESYFSVRYNSVMRFNPYAYPNTNPVIDWVGVYRVKNEGLQFFYPHSRRDYDTLYYLYRRDRGDSASGDTIEILQTGYSYFIAAHIDPSSLDSAVTAGGTRGAEEHFFDWMYRNDDSFPGVHPDSFMVINNIAADSTVRMYPPVDERMRHFTLYLTVYDWYLGERLRPRGFAFKCVRGVFSFR